jgi:hypothetical protein
MRRKVWAIAGALLVMVAMVTLPGHAVMKELSLTPAIDQGWMGTETGYKYSCGPRSAAEIMAYWALHGYPNLMSALPAKEVPDKSPQMINLFLSMVKYTTYDDYDFKRTLAEPKLAAELKTFLESKGYTGIVELAGFGKVTFDRIKKEIDAGRPVMLLVTVWHHWVVVKGYDEDTEQLQVLWGHPDWAQVLEKTIYFPSIKASETDPLVGANAVYIKFDNRIH